jgi:DNA repair protein RecO (recombination protein O)
MPAANFARTTAVTCRCRAYSETSQTLLFFSRDFGKMSGLAKGVIRPGNSFGGPFDTLMEYEITFVRKSSSSLHVITDAELVRPFRGLRGRFDGYIASNFLLEIVSALFGDEEPNTELYDLFTSALEAIDRGGNGGPISLGFALKALELAGLGLSLDACVLCGKISFGKQVQFRPSDGGVVCDVCSLTGDGGKQPAARDIFNVYPGDLRVLSAFASSDINRLSKINPGRDVMKRTIKIVRHALRFLLEKPLIMLEYLS